MGVGDHQLAQKGLTKVEAKDADLLVTYHAASNAEINATILDSDSYALSLGLPQTTVVTWSGLPPQGSTARLIRKGALAFEIIDRQRHQVIWSASAKVSLDEKRSKALDQLDKALIKIFNGYRRTSCWEGSQRTTPSVSHFPWTEWPRYFSAVSMRASVIAVRQWISGF